MLCGVRSSVLKENNLEATDVGDDDSKGVVLVGGGGDSDLCRLDAESDALTSIFIISSS